MKFTTGIFIRSTKIPSASYLIFSYNKLRMYRGVGREDLSRYFLQMPPLFSRLRRFLHNTAVLNNLSVRCSGTLQSAVRLCTYAYSATLALTASDVTRQLANRTCQPMQARDQLRVKLRCNLGGNVMLIRSRTRKILPDTTADSVQKTTSGKAKKLKVVHHAGAGKTSPKIIAGPCESCDAAGSAI